MESKFNIEAKIKKLNQLKKDLPKQLANVGQTYWQLNFDKEQWNGNKWQPRKESTWYANRMAGHHILVGRTGDLRRAMQNTIISFNWDRIVWGVKGVDYAGYINNGTSRMPKRQFIGLNEEVLGKLKATFEAEIDKVMR